MLYFVKSGTILAWTPDAQAPLAARFRQEPWLPLSRMVFPVGAWRSLVAHTLGVRVVAGSNPAAPTKRIVSRRRFF